MIRLLREGLKSDRLSGRNRFIVARRAGTTIKLYISERQGGGGCQIWQDNDRGSIKNRSTVARRVGTAVKLLVKRGERKSSSRKKESGRRMEKRGRRSTRAMVRGVRDGSRGIVNACQVRAGLWSGGERGRWLTCVTRWTTGRKTNKSERES